ncbi:unnamed protein product [Brachionus calyciflorus]|uniref:Oxalate:formate antiporter n=1 Tax=Brachionus calyciflorus TaxID=104777 RepID=A0A814E2H9_9BILA|nr:unnamed protein product [Brachionus calyciflorus]
MFLKIPLLNKFDSNELKKWSTLTGGFLIHFVLGSFFTFGNISPYMISYLREDVHLNIRYSISSWIATVYEIVFALGTLSSGFLNSYFKISIRITILIGSFFMTLGVALTYFSIKYSFTLTLVTYGGVVGLGTGFAYVGPMSLAMSWFPNRRGLANSIILFGYGASAIAFNQIQTKYINPNNISPDKAFSPEFPTEKYFSNGVLNRVPKVFLLLASIYGGLFLIGNSLLFENKKDEKPSEKQADDIEGKSDENVQDPEDINSLGINYKDPNQGMSLSDAFKNKIYYIMLAMIATDNIAASLVTTFYKTFGQTFIHNDDFLALVGSISNIFNAFGRLLWGFLIDRFPFKVCYLICLSFLLTIVGTIYLNKFIAIKEIYLLWVCAMFLCQCGLPVLSTVGCGKSFGQKNFSGILGSMYIASIPCYLISSVLASYTEKIGWFYFFLIGTGISFIAWIAAVLFNVKKSNGKNI